MKVVCPECNANFDAPTDVMARAAAYADGFQTARYSVDDRDWDNLKQQHNRVAGQVTDLEGQVADLNQRLSYHVNSFATIQIANDLFERIETLEAQIADLERQHGESFTDDWRGT